MYGILIRESDYNCIPGNYILKQQIDSKTNTQALLNKLVFETASTEKEAVYFPFTAQAMKADSVFWGCISAVVGTILDLVTLPYRSYKQASATGEWSNLVTFPYRAFHCALHTRHYQTELKEVLPLYQHLKEQNVAQKYVDQNRFEVTFYFDPETNEQAYIEDAVQGNRYNTYVIDTYHGVMEQKRGGNPQIAQALRQELQLPFIAKA